MAAQQAGLEISTKACLKLYICVKLFNFSNKLAVSIEMAKTFKVETITVAYIKGQQTSF